mmetsp:Transcript_25107/g.65267  ORF Transcript_25107/g.65267 Transcript_25107/m.65267 type:complete len:250 (+) Transcript_25107:487-1236(+)
MKASGVFCGVDAAQDQFAGLLVSQREGEDRRVEGPHQSLQRRGHAVHTNTRPGQTQNAVELAQPVADAQARRVVDLGEEVAFCLDIAHPQRVARVDAAHGPRAVLDGELRAVFNVCRRLVVRISSVGGEEGLLVRHPEVAAPGVEDDRELLARRAYTNFAVVLGVLVVLDDDGVAVFQVRGDLARCEGGAALPDPRHPREGDAVDFGGSAGEEGDEEVLHQFSNIIIARVEEGWLRFGAQGCLLVSHRR